MIEELSDIECGLIRYYFNGKNINLCNDHIMHIFKAADREVSTAGFITKIRVNDKKEIIVQNDVERWDNAGAIINGDIDSGFILYFVDGLIDTLEGYTYEKPWPHQVADFKFYSLLTKI